MGLVAGIALAYVWNAQDFVAKATMGPRDFQAGLIGMQQGISDIRVYPAQENAYFIQFKGYSGEPRQIVSVGPVVVYSSHGTPWRGGESAPNIRAYLNAVAAANAEFSYQYAWWREAKWLYAICAIGGVVLVGVIWPAILQAMARVGLAKPRAIAVAESAGSENPEAYDLNRFGNYEEPAIAAVATAPQDNSALEELNAAIERSIEDAPPAVHDAPVAEADAPAPAIRKLENRPLATAAGVERAEAEAKDFAGEFYPVARSGSQKPENDKLRQ